MLRLCLNKINKNTKETGSVKKSMDRTPKLLAERTMLKMQVLWHSVLQGTQEVLKSINKIGFLWFQFFQRYRRAAKKWYNAHTFFQVLFTKHLEFN